MSSYATGEVGQRQSGFVKGWHHDHTYPYSPQLVKGLMDQYNDRIN